MQYSLLEPPDQEEEKESRNTEISKEELIELARIVYRVFREDIEEIRDTESGNVIYKSKGAEK